MIDALGLPQSVLVLGGGSEIARSITRRLIDARATTVVLGGRPGSPALDQALADARERGATTVASVDFDAAEPASLVFAVDAAFDAHGDLDMVVVAFGVLGDQTAIDADPASAAHIATVNYTASVTAGLAAARRLRAQGHGTLLALSSVTGERVRKANFVYGSTKAGMDAFFQGLSDTLVGSGVRVVIVRPGFVRTRMTATLDPAPFATDADGVAACVIAGLAKGAPIIWAPPILRWVYTAFRHLPRPLWRRVPG
ncbi:MAG: decaprenylphospho-beta-D-erythro-pentofuranosid-2-ulose 2-reductase [Acidimicrobiales bacterium]